MLRRSIFAVIVLAALVVVSFAGQGTAGGEATRAAAAPFETIKSQHIVVMVKINDKGPFRLIFDTGAPVTLVNSRVAKEIGLLAKDAKPVGMLALVQHKAKSMELGELKAKDIAVMVMDHPTVAALDKAAGPVEGIIGLTLWGKFHMTIDYQAKQMTFLPTKFTPPDAIGNTRSALFTSPPKKIVVAPAGQWGFRVTKETKDEAPGVVVAEVLPGGPAAAAGLKAGDRLLTLDGRWADTVADCYEAAATVRPGTTAALRVVRGGEELELTVRVATGF
jgi:hypothetical protein